MFTLTRAQKVWLPLCALFGAYALACAFSAFRSGAFAFHDLGLLNDFFANAVSIGRPFYVTDLDLQHLRIHFTPTLLLLVPFYVAFKSQFLLVALGTIALYVGIGFQLRLFERLVTPLAGDRAPLLCGLATAFFGLNLFTKSVVLSAHIEIFFFLGASALVWCVLDNARWWVTAIVAALTFGIRQDAGFFVFFAMAVVALASPVFAVDRVRARRQAMVLGLLGVTSTVVIVVFVQPRLYGSGYEAARFWAPYGQTWGEIAITMLTSPVRVVNAIAHSGFAALNRSTGFIQWLSPVLALVANLPGILFFTASTDDKRLVMYYNSAFLLPGLFLATSAGFARLLRFSQLDRFKRWRWASAVPTAFLVVMVVISVVQRERTMSNIDFRATASGEAYAPLHRALSEVSARCPTAESVATDFRAFVFLSNTFQHYRLANFAKADLVLLRTDATTDDLEFASADAVRDALRGGFTLLTRAETVEIFVRADRRDRCH